MRPGEGVLTNCGDSFALSLTESANLDAEVQTLRAVLRDVFLDEGRRQEMRLYSAVTRLLSLVRRWLDVHGDDQAADEHARFAVTRYAQDMLATLLFLLDEHSLADAYDVSQCPPNPPPAEEWATCSGTEKVPQFYVSSQQRAFCAEWFFFLCARLPTGQVIHSLYPLLDTPLVVSETPSTGSPVPQHNHIAPGLLRRRTAKRTLLGHVLNGVVLSHTNGVQSLLQVLLLSSDVPSDLVFEASQRIVALICASVTVAWIVARDERGAVKTLEKRSVTAEQRIEWLSSQWMPLSTKRAEEEVGSATRTESSTRLAQRTTHATLPAETLENRLHLFVTMLCNAMITLPVAKVDTPVYRRAYRDFFLFNKHFLTPAFGALTLRKRPPVSEGDAAACVARLYTLADGATLGASARSFLTVFDTVSAGFLELTALRGQHAEASLDAVVASVWKCLDALDAHANEIAHALVRGALLRPRHSFAVANRVTRRLEYGETLVSQTDAALRALVSEVFGVAGEHSARSPTLQRHVFQAMAVECRSALYGVSALPEWRSPSPVGAPVRPHADSRTAVLLSLIETLCMTSPSEALFGADTTLLAVIELLIVLAPLSPLCFRWCVDMAYSVVSSTEMVGPFVGDGEAHLGHRVPRLARALREFAALVDHLQRTRLCTDDDGSDKDLLCAVQETETAVDALLDMLDGRLTAASPQSQRSVGLVHEVRLRWDALALKITSALETQAQAALSVALMELAASVEDASYAVHANDRTVLESAAQTLVVILLQTLLQSADVCACGHAIRAVVWLGMYRLDSVDTGFLAGVLCGVFRVSTRLTASDDEGTPLVGEAAALLVRVGKSPPEQVGRFKCRLLDVVLSWCDYDQEGRTLRNIDDHCVRVYGLRLFDLLKAHCAETQMAAVQVASLHCLGHCVVAVYPRISLSSVCGLCKDVFRHTKVEMAKAACAAMLSQVARTLQEQGSLSAVADVDMEEVLAIANAMAAYRCPYECTTQDRDEPEAEAEHLLHGDVIREKGCEVVRVMGAAANGLFLQEVGTD